MFIITCKHLSAQRYTSDESFFLLLSNPTNATFAESNNQENNDNDLLGQFEEILDPYGLWDEEELDVWQNAETKIQELENEGTAWTFATGTIYDQGKDPVLAIRGTEPPQFLDLLTDLSPQGIGFEQFNANSDNPENSQSYMPSDPDRPGHSLNSWLSVVTQEEDGTVSFTPHVTGHSLGGALTQWVAANYSGGLGQVITFNAPGIPQDEAQNFNGAQEVTHHVTVGDIVSMAGDEYIQGNVKLYSFFKPSLGWILDKHLLPVVTEKIESGSRDKPTQYNLDSTNITSQELSSDNFTYFPDLEYFVLQLIVAGVGGMDLGSKLTFRKDVEETRQQIGQFVFDAIEELEDTGRLELPDIELSVDPDFDGEGLIELGIQPNALLTLASEDLVIEYIETPETLWQIQGKVSATVPFLENSLGLDDPPTATADFTDDKHIKIGDQGIELVGEFSVENIPIVPNIWELKKASLFVNTEINEFKGEATVLIPLGIEIGAGLGFIQQTTTQNWDLNYVRLEANDLNKPIGTTGVFLQDIAGEIDNIAASDPDPLEFGGEVEITAGATITLKLPEWAGGGFSGSLAELEVIANINEERLKANGRIEILGGLIEGTGNAELNWNRGFLTANANFSALDGLITTSSSFRATSNLDLTMFGQATVSIPDVVPVIGGRPLASGSYLFDYSNDGILSNDFIAAWGTISIPLIGDITKGVKVSFDGEWDIFGAREIPSTNSFSVGSDTEWILLSADWTSPENNIKVQIIDNESRIINEDEFGNYGNIALVDSLTDANTKTVVIEEPTEGSWDIRLVDTNTNQVLTPEQLEQIGAELFAFQNSFAPTIEVTSPAVDITSSLVSIEWDASFDSNSPDTEISLFYDTDNEGFDGIHITDISDGSNSFDWETVGIPTGDYYIYAMIQDLDENGNFINVPAFSYSEGRVIIPESQAADLSVTQTASSDSVDVGDQLTYTITITNNGQGDATGVILTQTLPEDAIFVSATLDPNSQSDNTLIFELEDDLINGASTTIDITVVAPTILGNASGTALVNSEVFDPDATNDVTILDTTITNTQSLPTLSIDDVSIEEGNEGITDLIFTLTLSKLTTQTVTVDYTTVDDTATAGEDYTATSGTLTFRPSDREKTITVQVNGDTEVETNETFFLNLNNADNAAILDSQGVGTIEDEPFLTITDVTIVEGDSDTTEAVFTVTLSQSLMDTVTVDYATADDTAISGEDYQPLMGETLTFNPEETSKTITIEVNGDIDEENNETFFVNLSNANNAALLKDQGVGTIENNDIFGSEEDDILVGTDGDDVIQGFAGDDQLIGLAGNDTMDGGDNSDTVSYEFVATGVNVDLNAGTADDGQGGSDVLTDIENVIGSDFDDVIAGNAENNIIDGLEGNDTASYVSVTAAINVDLTTGIADDGQGGTDTLINIENVMGSDFDDNITGNNENNILDGETGNDVLNGLDGDDILVGGLGNDQLNGGPGSDRFVFNDSNEGIDEIDDFDSTEMDIIQVSASGFDGGLTANDFLEDYQFIIMSSEYPIRLCGGDEWRPIY